MKPAFKDKPVRTTPKGAWEGGIINERKEVKDRDPNEITTDSQGNGYPVSRHKQDS